MKYKKNYENVHKNLKEIQNLVQNLFKITVAGTQ